MSESNSKSVAKRIRETILRLSNSAKSAHAGSSLSAVEILTVCFGLSKSEGAWRDASVILSKGHAAMALYAAAYANGQLDEAAITNYLRDGSGLWGHPSVSKNFPFIVWSTGSLGHGLPVACGLAYARRLKGDARKIIVVLSDGELDEGSNWEAFLFAAHHRLSNLSVIVDYNKIQSFGRIDDVMALEPLRPKFEAFNWRVSEVEGHDLTAIESALLPESEGPSIVIAHTVKGKGVSEYEDTVLSHYRPISDELLKKYSGGSDA